MRWNLLLLVRTSSGAIGVALLAELPLLIRFSIDDRFVGADVEDNISSPRGEYRETRETRRV
jgi:hypothetical protein